MGQSVGVIRAGTSNVHASAISIAVNILTFTAAALTMLSPITQTKLHRARLFSVTSGVRTGFMYFTSTMQEAK